MKAIFAVPATTALVYRAWSHNSLTPSGIVVAALTAAAHAIHPWNLPFVLLVVFFLAGTRVTKVKKDVKEKLTIQSTGNPGGEGPRTHIQVLANSLVASVLTLLSAYQLSRKPENEMNSYCFPRRGDLFIVGIIANYAAVAADTFSSELGILSQNQPRLITSLSLRKVPRGTNGGVTIWGLLAGFMGSLIVVTSAVAFLPFCGVPWLRIHSSFPGNSLKFDEGWDWKQIGYFALGLTVWGALGSVLDSFLGGWLQQSVVDIRSGRVVEGEGGKKVLLAKAGPNSMHVKARGEIKSKLLSGEGKNAIPKPADGGHQAVDDSEEEVDATIDWTDRYDPGKKMRKPSFGDGEPSRIVESGLGLLDNNEVNFLMALTMSLGAMAIAGWVWDVSFKSIFLI